MILISTHSNRFGHINWAHYPTLISKIQIKWTFLIQKLALFINICSPIYLNFIIINIIWVHNLYLSRVLNPPIRNRFRTPEWNPDYSPVHVGFSRLKWHELLSPLYVLERIQQRGGKTFTRPAFHRETFATLNQNAPLGGSELSFEFPIKIGSPIQRREYKCGRRELRYLFPWIIFYLCNYFTVIIDVVKYLQ